jgi:hypothetical protein
MGNDDSRHDKPPRQRSSVADVIAEIKGETPKAPTLKDLPPPKSQLDKLYEELGGPADLGSAVDKNSFRRCCGEYSLVTVLPILRQFAKDETSARRHWPWAAYAINQYKFDIKELAKYRDEPRPKEIRDLVAQIRRASHDLSSALAKLQTLSFRLHDHTSPLRRGHLTWLNYVISQALADKISNEVIGDFVTIDLKKLEFIKHLAQLEAAAKVAAKRVDRDLLERTAGQPNPALPRFVWRGSEIWKSMTGRRPSTNKVARKSGDSDPDFVIFIQGLAKIGNAPAPSRKEVETALKKSVPPITSDISSKSGV